MSVLNQAASGTAAGASIGSVFPGVGTAIGGAVGGVIGGVSSLFGGGKEPNAGSSSFVDAIDNYEKISTSKARNMVPRISEMIAAGAGDFEIAKYIASNSRYGAGQSNNIYNSWKWQLVQNWIDKTRELQRRKIVEIAQTGGEQSIKAAGLNNPLLLAGIAAAGLLIFGGMK